MSEVLFDRLAKMVAEGSSRRDVLKLLGGFLAGGFLMGVTGKVRADDDRGKGRGKGRGDDDGGDDDDDGGDDDDDRRNEEINERCQRHCRRCPRRPGGVRGQCISHCKKFLRKNRKGKLCGVCTAANPFTGCVAGATCCAATKTAAAFCSNLGTDVNNCGACGTACTGTTPACCTGLCADLATDLKNCGACGTICTSGTTPGCCAGKCTDLATDNSNCGKCGTACATGKTCKAGVCT